MYNKHMLLFGLISWWYGAGWLQLLHRILAKLTSVLDFFSVDLLLKTLFSPYRQISAGHVEGAVGLQLRAWFDRQISRIIGAMVRLIVIVVGLLVVLLATLCGLCLALLWPFLPALPFISIVVMFGAVR